VVASAGEAGKIDLYAPLMSLPGIFQTTLATIPSEIPYLTPDPDLEKMWRKGLAAIEGFRIGIAWQGSHCYNGDRNRSILLRSFARW